MLTYFFRFISVVFHPVFYIFYLTLYLYYTTNLFYFIRTIRTFYAITAVILVNTVILPVLLTYLTQKDILLNNKEKRSSTYLITGFFYLFFIFLADRFSLPLLLINYLKISIIILVLLLLINFKIKVSLHAAGSATILALLFFLSSLKPDIHGVSLIIWLIICGLINSGRIYLQQHQMKEIAWGFFMGFIPSLIAFFTI